MGTTTLESLYQDIGRMAFEAAEGPVDQLLLYAEVEDGIVSATFFIEFPITQFDFATAQRRW
ncbi:hypothetical protein [Cupriavidus pauculus]|uniref:Uncharacterized protein n=1 Tax=Cupriavidus pauculus TaxID=82633 RepID=A0A3G8H850_9BURK|nr:hypothetical protein [Cupriavidus pauculus]AZG16409.1 hypothetical protein EHF44_23770 [Cupriavidus pauculus]